MTTTEKIKKTVRTIPDFPKPGIQFKDITPILSNAELCDEIADKICQDFSDRPVDAVMGVESRGFLFGLLVAQKLNVPFIPVRKKGKLPYETLSHKYELEYGTAEVEVHIDALNEGTRVLVHDDLLATGGTAAAAAELVKKSDARVAGFSFLIELEFLKGREKLRKFSENISSLACF